MIDKIKILLENAVNKSIPVIEDSLPDNFPCVTIHLYNEGGEVFGGGMVTEETVFCQVDVWYKKKTDNITSVIRNIKTAIANEKYFSHPRKENDYELDKKVYHTYYNFRLIIESEE